MFNNEKCAYPKYFLDALIERFGEYNSVTQAAYEGSPHVGQFLWIINDWHAFLYKGKGDDARRSYRIYGKLCDTSDKYVKLYLMWRDIAIEQGLLGIYTEAGNWLVDRRYL